MQTVDRGRNPYKTHTGIEKTICKRRTGSVKLQQKITGNRCATTVPGDKKNQETTGENNLGRIGKDEVPSSNLGSSSSESLVPQRLQGFSHFSDSPEFLGLASI